MNISDLDPIVKTLIGLGTLGGLAFGFIRWVRPAAKAVARDLTRARDSIVGRDALVDSITGRELSPAVPGIGLRMENTESQMTVLTDAVSRLADSHERLDDHDRRLTDQAQRIKALEDASVERVVARAESAAAWRAVEAVSQNGPSENTD